MLSQKMVNELNKQINAELFSSYLYLSMAAYFEEENLNGFANWMKMQSHEEYEHAMKFYDYIVRVGGKVKLEGIEEPKESWNGFLNAFEEAYQHELKITKMINDLADLAVEEKDHATKLFLDWFVEEQVEEVTSVQEIIHKLKLIEDNKSALFMINRELGMRKED